MAENNKTRFFHVLYSDKTRVFDQSERAYYPIYIVMIVIAHVTQRVEPTIAITVASTTFCLKLACVTRISNLVLDPFE